MKAEFAKPNFQGARFDEHTLPVEVARDLAAYEELIIELAKHLYLKEHPNRQRVPKGFEKNFNLHIDKIEGGSTKPVLAVVTAAALALQGANTTYYERARDLVTDSIAAISSQQPLPTDFPKPLLEYFNTFGRSLRENESVQFAGAGNRTATLTPQTRKALVLAAQKVYTKDVKLVGTVAEIDWEKETFRLRLKSGTAVTAHLPETHTESIRQAGGKERMHVLVKGVGSFDAYDHLQKVGQTSHVELLPNQALADELDDLAELTDGWFEGQGKAVDGDALAWATKQLISTFPEELPYPHVAPTPEGGLFMEWIKKPWRVSAEIFMPSQKAEFQATNTATGETIDEDLDMDASNAWQQLYDLVRRHV